MQTSSWVLLIFELLSIGVIAAFGMRQYISFKKTPLYALLSAWLGWFLCFSIVFLVPIDIVASDYLLCKDLYNTTHTPSPTPLPSDQPSPSLLHMIVGGAMSGNQNGTLDEVCPQPIGYLPPGIMITQWKILYWGTFVLSWAVFPILQTFSVTGDFRFQERIMRAIKDNVILYIFMGIFGLIGAIALVIVRSGEPINTLASFVFLLANAYGLILVVLTMGFGLVDIPRNLLRKSNRYHTLRHYRVEAVALKEDLEESRKKLNDHLRLIKTTSDRAGEFDPYRPYLDIIISKCPIEFEDIETGGDTDTELSYSNMYNRLLGKAFAIEDIIATMEHPEPREKKIQWSFKTPSKNPTKQKFEFYWEIYLFPLCYKILGALCAIMSLLIIWSEITLSFWSSKESQTKNFSPFALIIHNKRNALSGFGLQIFTFIPLVYMAVCAYTTLFKVRIYNYYRLVPQQQTNPMSIMFSAKLAAPLSYNLMQICALDDNIFTAAMGDMDAFSLGNKFVYFFPVFVCVICLISLFNVHIRIASCCCIKSLRAVTDSSDAAIDKGMKILKQVRDEQVEGVAPPKSRIGVLRDFITGKKSRPSTPDGAGAGVPTRPSYKPPQASRSHILESLSREYTSKSGTTFKSGNNNINDAILTSNSPSSNSSNNNNKSSKETKGLINYWDKLNFNKNNDDDYDDDDIELVVLQVIEDIHTEIEGINFDRPQAFEANKKEKIQYDAYHEVGGSFFESVPAADCYVLKMISHDWSDEKCLEILNTIDKSITPNGKIYIHDYLVDRASKMSKWVPWLDI
eukprot:gene18026-21517_t